MIHALAPDLHGGGEAGPIHDLVDRLNALGIPATVVNGRRGRGGAAVPRVLRTSLRLRAGDVLVVPGAVAPGGGDPFAHVPVVVLHGHRPMGFPADPLMRAWRGALPGWPSAVGLITTSPVDARMQLARTPPGFPVVRVPRLVDVERFRPAAKQRRIAVIAPRQSLEAVTTMRLLRRSPALTGWRLEPLEHGVSVERAAGVLSTAAVVVAVPGPGLCGWGTMEALASGCALVTLGGDGGDDGAMPAGTGMRICAPDLGAALPAVERVAARFDDDPRTAARRGADAASWVGRTHGGEAHRAAVAAVANALLAPDGPAALPGDALLRPRTRRASRLRRGPRSAVHAGV